jgi:hypothetical protein
MNRKHIIRMAREAGGADISMNGWTSWVGTQSTEFLERFATLVASAELERLAKVFDELDKGIGFYDPHEPAEIIRGKHD